NAAGLALDLDNNLYVVGSTSATSFPTASPFQSTNGGGTDAFISKIAQPPPPPALTTITTHSRPSNSDPITNPTSPSLSRAALARCRAGVGQRGPPTASSPPGSATGPWTYPYGPPLAEGTYAFTATATANGKTSTETGPFLVCVDLTAPTVTLNTDATTYTK